MKSSDKKILPIGIDEFKDVANNCYYVDKTPIISRLFRLPPGSAYLFTRPRRFGKSLMLSMLDCFYRNDENNEAYFLDKEIYKDAEAIKNGLNKFPLIHLDMKDAYGPDADTTLKKSKEILRREYERFLPVLAKGDIPSYDKEYIERILFMKADDIDFSSSLANLSGFLHKIYDKRVVILIDEYDTPIRSAYENGYYDEVITFYKQLYGEALKGNKSLWLGVLTGILQIGKESLFSGLNNLQVDSILSVNEYEPFGFNEGEVGELLSYYELKDHEDEVKQWYDGYLFGGKKVYNPLSVLNYIKEGGVASPYWVNTGENISLGKLLENVDESYSFSRLLSGNEVLANLSIAISYLDLNNYNRDALYSYLAFCGYLTLKEKYSGSYEHLARLVIPNKEIRNVFAYEVRNRYFPNKGSNGIYEIKNCFIKGDTEKLETLLEEYLLSCFSYYEFGNEKAYQILLLVLTSILFEDSIVKSEASEGKGRADIIIYPNAEQSIGIVIEVKCHKSKISLSKLKDSSLVALKQTQKKDYGETLKKAGVKSIIYYGVSFYQKNVKVSSLIKEDE